MRNRCMMTMTLGLALICGPVLADVVHSDFDPGGTYFGGTEGWFNYAGLPGFSTSTPTGGSGLWLDVMPQQYWGQITSQNWAVPDVTVSTWNASSSLEFDVIVNSLWYANNAAQQISVEFQTTGGVGGTVNQYANPTFDTLLKDTIQHVSIPLAGLQPFDATATGWNLSFNLSPGYAWEWDSGNPDVQPFAAHYYIDNITWVAAPIPEPGTGLFMLLTGIAVVVGATRSRRGAKHRTS